MESQRVQTGQAEANERSGRIGQQGGGEGVDGIRPRWPLVLLLTSLVALYTAPVSAADWLDLYADLLTRHTRAVDRTVGTVVDYAGLRGEPRWKKLVADLSATPLQTLQTREQKLAFWIDAYNILAIDLVVKNRPDESIKDVGSFFWPVWDSDAGEIGGRSVSLGEIEHKILRPMGDPRIHAAIVCASTSCPSLSRTPFRAETIDGQLDQAFRVFVADTRKGVRVDPARKRLFLSSIFDWFEEDFEARGGVVTYLLDYLPEDAAAVVRSQRGELEIVYLDYDWSLNRAKPASR